jgi:multiple sugar transport system permease protein
VGFVAFKAGPLAFSFGMSFFDWDIVNRPRFLGLANYNALVRDPLFWTSLVNTFYYLLWVPLAILLALPLALLLNQPVRGVTLFRALFYLPSVTSGAVVAMIWIWMLHPHYGIINSLLATVGLPGPLWLSSPDWAMPGLILVRLFYIGPLIVIFLAGLKAIPRTLYEAARMDGAGSWGLFRHVTLPLLTPVILFNLVMYTILALQAFTEPYVMTGGGPMNRTLLYVIYLYNNAFAYFRMGYASALAWSLFLVILLITVFQLRLSRRWVHY